MLFFFKFLLYSSKSYIGITTSKPSALSLFTPLIFEIQLINGALFLNATALFLCALFGALTVIVPFITVNASLKSRKSDLKIDVLILISLLTS